MNIIFSKALDDTTTLDDLKAIKEARAEYEAGEVIPEDAINWE